MNDREFKRQRKRIKRLVWPWSSRLGLGQWRIASLYDRVGADFASPDPGVPYGPQGAVIARTFASWQYLDSCITWNMPQVAQTPDEELEYAVVHELVHLLVNEMGGEDKAHEERVVTVLARSFLHVRQEATEYAVPLDGPKATTDAA